MNQPEESQGEMTSFNFGFLMESGASTVERKAAPYYNFVTKRIKLGVKL
jgi:hypothetical protein